MNRRMLACVALLLAGTAALAPATAARAPKNPCARWLTIDLLCRGRGTVTHLPPSAADAAPVAVRRARVKLPPGSTVSVGARSRATVTFARQAQCAFGLNGTPTEFVTRFGSDPLDAPSLYWQRTGNARCTFIGRRRPLRFFCELSDECPAVVTTTGRVQEITSVGPPARTSIRARAAEVVTTEAKLEFCAGRFRVEVTDEFGGAVVSGGSFVRVNGINEVSRVRVTLRKVDTYTQTDTGTIETHEIVLSSRDVDGYGDCADRVFERQRRWAAGR